MNDKRIAMMKVHEFYNEPIATAKKNIETRRDLFQTFLQDQQERIVQLQSTVTKMSKENENIEDLEEAVFYTRGAIQLQEHAAYKFRTGRKYRENTWGLYNDEPVQESFHLNALRVHYKEDELNKAIQLQKVDRVLLIDDIQSIKNQIELVTFFLNEYARRTRKQEDYDAAMQSRIVEACLTTDIGLLEDPNYYGSYN